MNILLGQLKKSLCSACACLALPMLCNASLAQSGAASDVIEHWNKISEKNSLVGDGKIPFHLKVAFKTFDLMGKPADQGTLEEWWGGDQGYRVEITSPNEHVVTPGPVDLTTDAARREHYLVMELFHSIVAPMAHLRLGEPRNILVDKRVEGKLKLDCYQATSVHMSAPSPLASFACVDDATMSVRQIPQGGETAARNSMGIFHDVIVALDVRIAYDNVLAIDGHVDTLQSLTSADIAEKLTIAGPSITVPQGASGTSVGGAQESQPKTVSVNQEVMAGRLTHTVQLQYPLAAQRAHVYGTVVMHVTVGADGKVQSVFPIAGPSSLLTESAAQAVKQWTYKPWEINGKPAIVETTARLNFVHR